MGFINCYVGFLHRARWFVVGFWLVTMCVGFWLGPKFLENTHSTFSAPHGTSAYYAKQVFRRYFPHQSSLSSIAVLIYDSQRSHSVLTDTNFTRVFSEEMRTRLVNRSDVASVNGYYSTIEEFPLMAQAFNSEHDHATLMRVQYTIQDSHDKSDLIEAVRNANSASRAAAWAALAAQSSNSPSDIPGYAWMRTGVTGLDVLFKDIQDGTKEDMVRMDTIVLPIAMVVLSWVVRSWRLMVIPLVCVATSILFAFSVMLPVAVYGVNVASFAPSVMMSLTIAMSIDYSLFLLTRYREEVLAGASTLRAVLRMTQFAGRIVLVSGSTLSVTFLGLAFFPMDFLRSIGLGATVSLLCTMLINLTFTPAVLLCFPNFFRTFGFGLAYCGRRMRESPCCRRCCVLRCACCHRLTGWMMAQTYQEHSSRRCSSSGMTSRPENFHRLDESSADTGTNSGSPYHHNGSDKPVGGNGVVDPWLDGYYLPPDSHGVAPSSFKSHDHVPSQHGPPPPPPRPPKSNTALTSNDDSTPLTGDDQLSSDRYESGNWAYLNTSGIYADGSPQRSGSRPMGVPLPGAPADTTDPHAEKYTPLQEQEVRQLQTQDVVFGYSSPPSERGATAHSDIGPDSLRQELFSASPRDDDDRLNAGSGGLGHANGHSSMTPDQRVEDDHPLYGSFVDDSGVMNDIFSNPLMPGGGGGGGGTRPPRAGAINSTPEQNTFWHPYSGLVPHGAVADSPPDNETDLTKRLLSADENESVGMAGGALGLSNASRGYGTADYKYGRFGGDEVYGVGGRVDGRDENQAVEVSHVPEEVQRSFWFRSATWSTQPAHAVILLVLVLALFAPLLWRATDLKTTVDVTQLFPKGSSSYNTYKKMTSFFSPGRLTPYYIVLSPDPAVKSDALADWTGSGLPWEAHTDGRTDGDLYRMNVRVSTAERSVGATGLSTLTDIPGLDLTLGDVHSSVDAASGVGSYEPPTGLAFSESFFNWTQRLCRRLSDPVLTKGLLAPDGILSYTYLVGVPANYTDVLQFYNSSSPYYEAGAEYRYLVEQQASTLGASGVALPHSAESAVVSSMAPGGQPVRTVVTVDPTVTAGPVLNAAFLELTVTFNPLNDKAQDFVDDVRGNVIHRHYRTPEQREGVAIHLSGTAVEAIDSVDKVYSLFPIEISVTAGLVFLMVAFSFKSLFLPLRLLFTIALPILFVFGLSVLVFMDGWGSELYDEVAAIYWLNPVMAFSILVGLGLDYDVFLYSRVVEYRRVGYTDRAAVIKGLYKTGGIITAAGLIMAIAFFGLALASEMVLKEFGFMLCCAVLVDTFIVRTALVPAILALAGKVNWWPANMPPGIYDHTVDVKDDEDRFG